MILIDTHTHLYLNQFDNDRAETIHRSLDKNVLVHLLPNIDRESIPALLHMAQSFPASCFPMMGLHPTSVKDDFETELNTVITEIETGKYIGIGEIGIDLYWDKTFREQQEEVFKQQLVLADKLGLAVSIHSRNSLDIILKIINDLALPGLKGILHCYPGNLAQARKAIEMGLYLGIGGVVTYKNSGLQEVIRVVGCDHLVLETDAPFLPPVPYRGQRNESSYLPFIAERIAWITGMEVEEVAAKTTENALQLYPIKL